MEKVKLNLCDHQGYPQELTDFYIIPFNQYLAVYRKHLLCGMVISYLRKWDICIEFSTIFMYNE